VRERAEAPFEFYGCIELRRMLGLRAETEKQLVGFLKQVSLDSVCYHTHGSLLRHRYRAGVYSNDFASWAAVQVRDRVLGERLAVLDPIDFVTLSDLRERIISVVTDHLKSMTVVPRVVHGEPFEFIESWIVGVPLGIEAHTLEEFRKGLSDLDNSAIYFHAVEARVRLERRRNDFAAWLEDSLDLPGLAARVEALDPHMGGLERLRSRMLASCDEVLDRGRDL